MKLKTIPIKFVFNFKMVRIKHGKVAEFKLAVMRKGKNSETKLCKFDPALSPSIEINQTIQFCTTIQFDEEKSSYVRKTASLQMILKDIEQKQYTNSSEVELLDYLSNEPTKKSIKIAGELESVLVEFQVSSNLPLAKNNLKSMTNLKEKFYTQNGNDPTTSKIDPKQFQSQAFINNDFGRKNEQIKSSKLLPKKKQKTLMLMTEKAIGLATTEKQIQFSPEFVKTIETKKSKGTILKNPLIETKLLDNKMQKAQEKKGSDCSIEVKEEIQIERHVSKKKSVKILDEQTSYTYKANDHEESEKLLRMNSYNNECKQLNDRIKGLEKELNEANQLTDRLKRNEKLLEEKIYRLEKSQKNTEEGKQAIIKKLYEEISQKNTQIKQLKEECEKQNKKWRELEENNHRLKEQMAEIKLEKEKITLESKYTLKKEISTKDNKDNTYKLEIEKLKRQYEEEILELKQEIQKKNKLITQIDSQNSMIRYDDDEACYSKKCDAEKKDLNNKIKQLKKNLDDVEKKLESKEKLIKNYQALNEDRQKQNSKQKEQDKWKGQRMILEQKIEELNLRQHQLYEKPVIQQKKIQQQLQNCKIERDNLAKQLQRSKINLNRITKDKEDIQDEIIKSKQRVMDILNAVQEHGGMKLFDQISNHIL